MKLTKKLSLIALTVSATSVNSAQAFSLEGTIWQSLTKVDPVLLYSIALVESRRTDQSGVNLRPWPWALNWDGQSYYFDKRSEAEEFLSEVLAQGYDNIDVGPFQVNLYWHGHRVQNPMDLFDLSISMTVAQDILFEAISSSPDDDVLAVGRYHTWKDQDASRAYGLRVLRIREALMNSTTGEY